MKPPMFIKWNLILCQLYWDFHLICRNFLVYNLPSKSSIIFIIIYVSTCKSFLYILYLQYTRCSRVLIKKHFSVTNDPSQNHPIYIDVILTPKPWLVLCYTSVSMLSLYFLLFFLFIFIFYLYIFYLIIIFQQLIDSISLSLNCFSWRISLSKKTLSLWSNLLRYIRKSYWKFPNYISFDSTN